MKKSIWITFVIMAIVTSGYLGYRSYTKKQQERHIFCETLFSGMTSQEVLASLRTFGEIGYNKTDVYQSGFDQIAVGYTDTKLVGQRVYLLSFRDGKYMGVSAIVGFEKVDYFCD